MPSPIPVTRLLPKAFRLQLGAGSRSSPLSRRPTDSESTLRVPVFPLPGKFARILWSSVINWRELHILESIGSGGFGSVFRGTYFGETVAVKRVTFTKNKLSAQRSFWAELNAAHLRHPNLVRVIAASPQADGDDGHGRDVVGTVVMEFAGESNLHQVIYGSDGPLRPDVCMGYASDLACALRYLHGHGVVHLDVKPANVIVSGGGLCKLADFGCSIKMQVFPADARDSQIGGTFTHRAPELLQGQEVTPTADIYSFGVTLWQMITREPPYDGEWQHVVYAVVALNLRPDLSGPVFSTPGPFSTLTQLIKLCWSPEPSLRPSAEQLLRQLRTLQTSTPGLS